MPRHSEKRRMPYAPGQMYDLVADVKRYPEFLPWVLAMRVRKEDESETIADMVVGFKAIRETFTSKVVKTPKLKIHVEYIEGPLQYLRNDWSFDSDGEGGCLVHFEVDFAFRNRLFQSLAGQFFEKALMRMIGAFETRAEALYGDAGGSSSSSAQITA
ncbi:type II toxin-antitoxin system RatA family toxin [Novosphingopyxis sp.]|uniref:type II toxin-antitoxin system RatA family toxin n=1 Tax=Novosphingopyxis sp. TaxID=2709690 RepID=UPI003B595B69